MMISRIILNDFGNVIKLFVVLNLQTCSFDDLSPPKLFCFGEKELSRGCSVATFGSPLW